MKYNIPLLNYDQVYREIRGVFVCAYTIDTSGTVPFIKYLFTYNSAGQLTFPKLQCSAIGIDCDSMKCEAAMMLQFHFKIDNATFKGYDIQDSNVYLFFDINCKLEVPNARFCLIDEIVNTRSCFGHQIATSYFRSEMLYLYDDNGRKYENPVAGYRFSDNLSFDSKIGVSKSDSLSLLGPYYYFTDYANAVSNG